MGRFQAKEGLFEYTEKRLEENQRLDAIRRIRNKLKPNDESLNRFMGLSVSADEADDAAETEQAAE